MLATINYSSHLWLLLLVASPLIHDVYAQSDIGDWCSTSEGQGTCQLINQCPSVYNNLRSGKRPEVHCGYKDITPIVCCPSENGPAFRIATSETRQPVNHLADVVRPARQMCAEYEDSVVTFNRENGRSNLPKVATRARHFFILEGSAAEPMEFPHMAAVGYQTNESKISWDCGGTLISHRFVLTAAHCTISPQWGDARWVRLGDLRLSRGNAQPQVLQITKRIRHPDYQRPVQYNDIALLKLQQSVRFNAYVKPACLDIEENHPAGQMTVATGWGIVDWENEIGSENLLKVDLPIVAHSDCASFYTDDTNRLPNGIDDRNQICAGGNGKDTCQGDSGGPLIVIPKVNSINVRSLHDVIGVTSFGQLCGSVSPGIYTRVSFYLFWIETIVWPDNLA